MMSKQNNISSVQIFGALFDHIVRGIFHHRGDRHPQQTIQGVSVSLPVHASCGSQSRLLPLLLFWRHYLLSVTHSRSVHRRFMFYRMLWRLDLSWMEMSCLCRPPRHYHQQQERRKTPHQRWTAAFLRTNWDTNHLKNCGTYSLFYFSTYTKNRKMTVQC